MRASVAVVAEVTPNRLISSSPLLEDSNEQWEFNEYWATNRKRGVEVIFGWPGWLSAYTKPPMHWGTWDIWKIEKAVKRARENNWVRACALGPVERL